MKTGLREGATLARVLVVGALLLSCLSFFIHAVSLLRFPFEIDPGEGFDVYGAVRLLAGGDLYGDPSRFPFFGLSYPPVYAGVLAPFVALFGPSMAVGRGVSLVAGLGTAVVIGFAARFPRRSLLASVVAGSAFLTSAYVFHVAPVARVTSLMLFFGVAGLFCLERAAESRTRQLPLLLTGIGLLVAGVYTKPVGLDAAAAGLTYLAVRRPPGWLLGISAAVGLLAGIHLGLDWVTSGRYGNAVLVSNAYPWDGEQALGYSRNFLETHAPLIVLGIVGAAAHVMSRWFSVWVFYLAMGVVTAATAGRWGAGESYFLPIVIACCVLGGRVLAWSTLGGGRGHFLALGAFGLFALTAGVGPWPLRYLVPGWDRGFQAHALSQDAAPSDLASGQRVVQFISAAQGPVLSEAAGFVMAAGQTLVGNPMLIRGLATHGLYDQGPLIAALRGGTIRAVILLGQWYPPDVLQAIGEHYERTEQIEVARNVYLLYVPRQ